MPRPHATPIRGVCHYYSQEQGYNLGTLSRNFPKDLRDAASPYIHHQALGHRRGRNEPSVLRNRLRKGWWRSLRCQHVTIFPCRCPTLMGLFHSRNAHERLALKSAGMTPRPLFSGTPSPSLLTPSLRPGGSGSAWVFLLDRSPGSLPLGGPHQAPVG